MTLKSKGRMPTPRGPYEGKPMRWVSLEWSANYRAAQPLIEHILKRNSSSSGVWLGGEGTADASWDADEIPTANSIYNRLVDLCKAVKFAPYTRVRFMELLPGMKTAKVVKQWKRGKTPVFKMRKFHGTRKRKKAA